MDARSRLSSGRSIKIKNYLACTYMGAGGRLDLAWGGIGVVADGPAGSVGDPDLVPSPPTHLSLLGHRCPRSLGPLWPFSIVVNLFSCLEGRGPWPCCGFSSPPFCARSVSCCPPRLSAWPCSFGWLATAAALTCSVRRCCASGSVACSTVPCGSLPLPASQLLRDLLDTGACPWLAPVGCPRLRVPRSSCASSPGGAAPWLAASPLSSG